MTSFTAAEAFFGCLHWVARQQTSATVHQHRESCVDECLPVRNVVLLLLGLRRLLLSAFRRNDLPCGAWVRFYPPYEEEGGDQGAA